jgi:HlyD family secretion protein
MRRAVFIVLAIAALGAAAAAFVHFRGGGDQIGATVRVERGDIERVVVASGTIEPEQLIEVRPRISGIVEHFHVDAGDRVKAGQVVAEIERETLEAAVREARAVLREAEVARDHAGVELQRKSDLFKRGVESEEVLDRDRAAHAGAEARLARARATLERLEQELAYATITAPIDGVVLRRDLDPGAAVASVVAVTGGTVLMVIADTSRMHLLGTVDENEIAGVRVGQDARIRTEAHPDEVFRGRVRKIASIGDRKDNVTSFQVEVDVIEGIERLSPRMSGDADVVVEVRRDTVIVPETALRYDGDSVLVDVVERASEPHLVARPVRVGILNGNRVEIVEGLAAGEEVKQQ